MKDISTNSVHNDEEAFHSFPMQMLQKHIAKYYSVDLMNEKGNKTHHHPFMHELQLEL